MGVSWTTVYLVCFWLGFSLSAISWLLGTVMPHLAHLPHLPHIAHGPHGAHHGGGAHPHASHAAQGDARAAHGADVEAPSFFNFATATAFLAWFGGAGYLISRYTEVWPVLGLLVAIGSGVVGAALVFFFMAKVLWSA